MAKPIPKSTQRKLERIYALQCKAWKLILEVQSDLGLEEVYHPHSNWTWDMYMTENFPGPDPFEAMQWLKEFLQGAAHNGK